MAGIFGPSADEMRLTLEQEGQASDMGWANATPEKNIIRLAAQAGRSFGRGIEALGGYQDPRMRKAKLLEEAKMEVDSSGADLLADPKSYYGKAFEALQKRGLMDEAMGVRQLMMDEAATQADINYKNAQAISEANKGLKGRFTQNSKGQVINTATGEVVQKGSPIYEAASSQAKIFQDYVNGAFGDPSSEEAKVRYEEAITKANYMRPPSTVTVDNRTEGKYYEEIAKGAAESFIDTYSRSSNAASILDNASDIEDIINNSDAIIGPGADLRLGLAKIMNIAGADNADTIAATQAVMSRIADTTLKAIPDSNLGGGQGFTERDKEFLKSASGGDFTWTKDSLMYLNWVNKRRAYNLIKSRNALFENKTPDELQKYRLAGIDPSIKPLPEIGERPSWNKAWESGTKRAETKTKPISDNVPKDIDPDVWEQLSPRGKELYILRQKSAK